MIKIILLVLFVSSTLPTAFGQTLKRCDYKDNKKDKRMEEEFRRLHAYEADLILRGDAAALDEFYPEDHIVTNPFNQMMGKQRFWSVCGRTSSSTSLTKRRWNIYAFTTPRLSSRELKRARRRTTQTDPMPDKHPSVVLPKPG